MVGWIIDYSICSFIYINYIHVVYLIDIEHFFFYEKPILRRRKKLGIYYKFLRCEVLNSWFPWITKFGFAIYYLIVIIYYLVIIIYYLLIIIDYLVIIIYYLVVIIYLLLFIIYWLLFII